MGGTADRYENLMKIFLSLIKNRCVPQFPAFGVELSEDRPQVLVRVCIFFSCRQNVISWYKPLCTDKLNQRNK